MFINPEAQSSLGIQFSLGLHYVGTINGITGHVVKLILQLPSTPEVWTNVMRLQATMHGWSFQHGHPPPQIYLRAHYSYFISINSTVILRAHRE